MLFFYFRASSSNMWGLFNSDMCVNTTSLGLLAVKLSELEENPPAFPRHPTSITQRPLRDEIRDNLCR
jgi:hypothetical protein